MSLRPSAPDPDGHVVIAETGDDTRVVASFVDGSEPVELTGRLADLVLLGMHLDVRRTAGIDAAPAPDAEVTVGDIDVAGPAPVFTYAHPRSGTAIRFGWDDAAKLVAAAVTDLITAGVAADVAADETPDDASDAGEQG